jgi:hypothetical protein
MDGSLEGAVAVILIVLLGMFIVGAASAIASIALVIMKKKPVLSIILSVVSLPLIVIPLFFTVGTFSLRLAVPLMLILIIIVTVLSVLLIKINRDESNSY